MRLCIADPPYLGRSRWYTAGGRGTGTGFTANGRMDRPADGHPDARLWDDPATHVALVDRLTRYDGWAIAMSRDSLPVYLAAAPHARVCVWHNPAAWPPGGNSIHATWEPVLVNVPAARRTPRPNRPKDVLIATPPRHLGFVGAKPKAWTRWVLDMLGYDPATDTVDDMFPGSGAVTAEIQQGTLL